MSADPVPRDLDPLGLLLGLSHPSPPVWDLVQARDATEVGDLHPNRHNPTNPIAVADCLLRKGGCPIDP